MSIRTTVAAVGLAALAAAPLHPGEPDAARLIGEWLKFFDAAFSARDLERLAGFYHPDVTIYEGGGTNDGWADYRDHHLGPELAEMEGLEFGHSNVSAHLLGAEGWAAYVTSEYRLKARIGGKDVDARGLETLVLVKDDAGAWRIRHAHTSSRRRPPPGPSPHP